MMKNGKKIFLLKLKLKFCELNFHFFLTISKKYGLTRADSKLRIPTTASFKSKASFKSRASIRTRTCDTSPTTSILNKPLANGDLVCFCDFVCSYFFK
jgi:hypothetical protein